MKLRRWFLLGAVFLLSLFVSVGCAQNAPTGGNAASAGGGAPISIGFSAWPGWFPWQVATEEGLFAKNNVNVEMKWFDGYLEEAVFLAQRIYVLTAHPGRVQREMNLDWPIDRTYTFKRNFDFQDCREEIMSLLRGEAEPVTPR